MTSFSLVFIKSEPDKQHQIKLIRPIRGKLVCSPNANRDNPAIWIISLLSFAAPHTIAIPV